MLKTSVSSQKEEITKSPQVKRKGSSLEKGEKTISDSLSSEEERAPSKV